jgi:hypothetical protein
VQAAEPGGQPIGRWSGRPPDEPARGLVRLVTRLVVAQAVAATAVGLPFSRRQLSSILITLAMVAALCALAVLARNGTRSAWRILVTGEAAFVIYGLSRFFFARYLGGTLFAIITAGALLHPAVARAYGAAPAGSGEQSGGEAGQAAGEAFGGQVVG